MKPKPHIHKRPGRPLKDRRKHLTVAATTDYRGTNDDQLCFLFRGAPRKVISDTFHFLVGNGKGIAAKASISEESDILRRNGKSYWRTIVQMSEPNFHFASLEEQKLLIASAMNRHHPCTLQWLPLDKFLNI